MSHVTACRRCGEPLLVSPGKRLTGPQRGKFCWSVWCTNKNCVGRVGGEQARDYYGDQQEAMAPEYPMEKQGAALRRLREGLYGHDPSFG